MKNKDKIWKSPNHPDIQLENIQRGSGGLIGFREGEERHATSELLHPQRLEPATFFQLSNHTVLAVTNAAMPTP